MSRLALAVVVLALCVAAAAAPAPAPAPDPRKNLGGEKGERQVKGKVETDLFKPRIVPRGTVQAQAQAVPTSLGTLAGVPLIPPPSVKHPKLPAIGGLVEVYSGRSGSVKQRLALVKRDRMQVALRGWISDFFARFQKVVSVLTDKVKAIVLNTVSAFEDRAVAVFKDVDALWDYFKASPNLDKAVSDLWLNTRCDICQSALLHIYTQGCGYAQNGICSIVSHVACGPLKAQCDKFLCPLIKKVWLQPECNNIMSRLDAVLLDKQTGTKSPLDNFNTLAVCKRVGFCRAMDAPFDSQLLRAIANQARVLTQKLAETKDKAQAVAAATAGVSPVVIPSKRVSADKKGTYPLPGLKASISIWLNIQRNSPGFGKPYYMFWNMVPGGPAKLAGIKELEWLNKINGKHIWDLGPQGVLDALNATPGTTADLEFEVSGFFGSKFVVRRVQFTEWPVNYASISA